MEDIEVVAPAVEILRRDGIEVRGPLPADTMFHAAARKTYDCAICMYHDQALIPIKSMAFEDAVNVTLDCRSSAPHRITAPPSTLPAPAAPIRRASSPRCGSPHAWRRPNLNERIDDLPPLRDVIREHSLSARKSLGQNFLLDLNLTARIARAAGPLEGATVIEVGPGPGGLTRALLALGAGASSRSSATSARWRHSTISEALSGPARDRARRRPAFRSAAAARRRARNTSPTCPTTSLPPLLIDWLSIEPWPPWYDMMVLMFQREVAERIVAQRR